MISPKTTCLMAVLSLYANVYGIQAYAVEWKTGCGRSSAEETSCRNIKGDAILGGQQGWLHTIVFPNGDKRQYFYTGGGIASLEGLKVRKSGESWLTANGYIDNNNRLYFQLPSGNIFMWVNASVD